MKNPFSKEERLKRYKKRVRKALRHLRERNRIARLEAKVRGEAVSIYNDGELLSPRDKKKFHKLQWANYRFLTWGDDVSGIEFIPDKRAALSRIADAAIGVDPDLRKVWVEQSDERARSASQEPRIVVTFWNQNTGQLHKGTNIPLGTIELWNGKLEHPVYLSSNSAKKLTEAGKYRWDAWVQYGEDWKSHVSDYIEPVVEDEETEEDNAD